MDFENLFSEFEKVYGAQYRQLSGDILAFAIDRTRKDRYPNPEQALAACRAALHLAYDIARAELDSTDFA